MIQELVLGAATLLMGSSEPFFEQPQRLDAGQNTITTEQPWNAVTAFTADGAALPVIEYFDGQRLVPWHLAEQAGGHADNALDLVIFDDVRQDLTLYTPAAAEVVFHFFNTQRPGEDLVAQFDEVSTGFLESGYADTFKGKNLPKFYTRADWGADESLRVQNFFQRIFRPSGARWYAKEAQAVEPKYRPVVTQTKTADGKSLFWPVSENPQIAKFIVHHTGEALDSTRKRRRTPKEIMRAIYYYHTVTRGWGDIGYNYVIDKDGNIYEGRAGGPKAVGAHTAYHNVGSIGISLMGNFEYEQPTEAQIDVLALLLADHARRFDVDPLSRTRFLNANSHNISGHRDVARIGHGTSCPGRHLVARLPEIRQKTADTVTLLARFEKEGIQTTRDFLQKSTAARKHLKDTTFKLPEREIVLETVEVLDNLVIKRGASQMVEFTVQNNTDFVWEQGAELTLKEAPDGVIASQFRVVDRILSQAQGKIRGKIKVNSTPNGKYYVQLWPTFLEDKFFENKLSRVEIEIPLQVSGSTALAFSRKLPLQANSFTKTPTTIKKSADFFKTKSVARPTEPKVKIKLADFDNTVAQVSATAAVELWEGSRQVATVPAYEKFVIVAKPKPGRDELEVRTEAGTYIVRDLLLRNPGILTLHNYENAEYGSGRIKYNAFRGDFHWYTEPQGNLLVVNQLPLEQYLWGLGEQPSTEPDEKKHAIHILARSYALAYMGDRRKFRTDKYDLENSSLTSQLYLGYDWERRRADQKALLQKTRGRVITYNGKVVVGPYFTQSAGETSDKWSHVYPWTKQQKLPFDEGLQPRGHGVGMSGNTARVLAEQGKRYDEIIAYFFDGLKIQKRY